MDKPCNSDQQQGNASTDSNSYTQIPIIPSPSVSSSSSSSQSNDQEKSLFNQAFDGDTSTNNANNYASINCSTVPSPTVQSPSQGTKAHVPPVHSPSPERLTSHRPSIPSQGIPMRNHQVFHSPHISPYIGPTVLPTSLAMIQPIHPAIVNQIYPGPMIYRPQSYVDANGIIYPTSRVIICQVAVFKQ